jgi:hypothetical protein
MFKAGWVEMSAGQAGIGRAGRSDPPHELHQLGTGIDAQFGECIVDMGFHGGEIKVQLGRDIAVDRALCDEIDDLELGVGKTVPTRLCPRVADDAAFHAQGAQLPAHPARIGERFVAHMRVECGIELAKSLVLAAAVSELAAGVLSSRGVEQRARRRLKQVGGSHQRLGITLEDPSYIAGNPGE